MCRGGQREWARLVQSVVGASPVFSCLLDCWSLATRTRCSVCFLLCLFSALFVFCYFLSSATATATLTAMARFIPGVIRHLSDARSSEVWGVTCVGGKPPGRRSFAVQAQSRAEPRLSKRHGGMVAWWHGGMVAWWHGGGFSFFLSFFSY
ncbi:uncharacterized protein EKO05_0008797 [Ascochyta rabiei]|uniref:uncharacterized protein n=1 Tax=Didymella rabiei TaxID=5454 RepID=UPI002205244A|nr:uncharacterized protein EKO05_0008797 [Ascochyta rabiei]UPX18498.1 hypothetical protein EKO05_0008797 [Ascochyta rabiei]